LLERASFSLLDRRRQQPAKSVTKNRGLLQYATSCSQGGDITFAAARAFQFAIRIDSIRYANRFESIRFVKIDLSIH